MVNLRGDLLIAWCAISVLFPSASAHMGMRGHVMEMRDETPPDALPPPRKMTGIGNVHMRITARPEAQMW